MAKSSTDNGETLPQRDRREEQERLAKRFVEKMEAGENATQKERRAYEKSEEEETQRRGLEFWEAVPKKLYSEKSGRQTKVLHDQARLHGAPLFGDTISMPKVILWIHNFLAENKFRLARPDSDDPLLAGMDSPALERYRNAAADCKELDRDKKKDALIPREEMHGILVDIAHIWQSAEEAALKDSMIPAKELLKEIREELLVLIEQVAVPNEDSSSA